jgi:hypothetical protein
MRIDLKGTISGCAALVVRKAPRCLRTWDQWEVGALEVATARLRGPAPLWSRRYEPKGLIEASGSGAWTTAQAG